MTTTAQNKRAGVAQTLCLMLIVTWTIPVSAQNGTENGEWRYWGGDERSTRYSPLDQIDAGNVADLEMAWRRCRRTIPVVSKSGITPPCWRSCSA